jgi:hypothetical protein
MGEGSLPEPPVANGRYRRHPFAAPPPESRLCELVQAARISR